MRKTKLGKTGLEIAPLVLGGNVFGWTAQEEASERVLDAFLNAGCNCIDTADIYSVWVTGHQGGESERILGRWMHRRQCRNKVVLVTKVGMQMGPGRKGLSKAHILRSAEESLTRLKTDVIDLYFAHQDDPETPLEETLGAFDLLLRQGKIRALGASNYSAPRLEKALKISQEQKLARYEVFQPPYNLCDRAQFEEQFEKLVVKEGMGVICYYALASGFLTGKYRSEKEIAKSARSHQLKTYANERGWRILAALDQVASEEHITPAQAALAWIMRHPAITAPIASATTVEQLTDLLKAIEVKLSPSAMELLQRASEY